MQFGEQFVENNTFYLDDQHWFLRLGDTRQLQGIRKRFVETLKNAKDNLALAHLLNQIMKPADIEKYFYPVWRAYVLDRARVAKFQAEAEENRLRRIENRTKEQERILHRDCVEASSNMSVKEAAKLSRLLV